MRPNAILIDDDPLVHALVREVLSHMEVISCFCLGEAREQLRRQIPSLAFVDIELPDGDGLHFLGELAASPATREMPVIVLSGHNQVGHRVSAFVSGVEDFIGKPVEPAELLARVENRLRKREVLRKGSEVKRWRDLIIDSARQKALRSSPSGDVDLDLTVIELRILTMLLRRPEQVFSRDQIMENVWGTVVVGERTVDSHVAHIRQKVEGTGVELQTIRGLGYSASLCQG